MTNGTKVAFAILGESKRFAVREDVANGKRIVTFLLQIGIIRYRSVESRVWIANPLCS